MRNLKLFSSRLIKFNFAAAIFFMLFLSVFLVRFAYAHTCIPDDLDWFERVKLNYGERPCPNSFGMCHYGIMETRFKSAQCVSDIIMTTVSKCRIRENPGAVSPFWELPFFGTLLGPCFPPVGSVPCGDPNRVTNWWQWVEPIGPEDSCRRSLCWFCSDDSDDRPDCGLQTKKCPPE